MSHDAIELHRASTLDVSDEIITPDEYWRRETPVPLVLFMLIMTGIKQLQIDCPRCCRSDHREIVC